MNSSENSGSRSNKPSKPGVLQVAFSTVAAAFGVQSSTNRERDFAEGNILSFIIAGVIFTTVFVGGLILLVNLLLRNV